MIERFNHTFKTTYAKEARVQVRGSMEQLPVWSTVGLYHNVPYSSIGEKPSFLLYGFDCRHPTEAVLLPAKSLGPTDVSDYREELVPSLSSARALANKANAKSQSRQKAQYDKQAN